MSTSAIVFMLLAWTIIGSGMAWCMFKVLSSQR
jgi:hypothetical protein